MMKLVCEHDPHNPDHLVCGAKWSRIDIALLVGAMILVLGSLIFFVKREIKAPANLPSGESQSNLSKGDENVNENPQYSGQSDLYLESEALYFSKEGEQIGRGPWPLEAGKETKVKVFLKIYGGPSSEASKDGPHNIVVTGKLGTQVQWTGFVPIGRGISYEPDTRAVRWNVQDEPQVVFEIAIIPTAAQVAEEHLTILHAMTIFTRNSSGVVIGKVLTPDILLFSK